MKNIKTILLALLICSLSLACKKDKMPQPTQVGANTMYAKVNGKPWQPKGCISCGSAFQIGYDDRINFSLTGRNNDQGISITIVLRNLKTVGTYELSSTDMNFGNLNNTTSNHGVFVTTKLKKGSVTITKLDLENKIIAGTFNFIAEDENDSAKTVSVTDGWFDGKYRF